MILIIIMIIIITTNNNNSSNNNNHNNHNHNNDIIYQYNHNQLAALVSSCFTRPSPAKLPRSSTQVALEFYEVSAEPCWFMMHTLR